MVNSGSFESEGGSLKGQFTQMETTPCSGSSPRHVGCDAVITPIEYGVCETKLEHNTEPTTNPLELQEKITSLQCKVPLEKIRNVLDFCLQKTERSNELKILENYLFQNVKVDDKAKSETPKPGSKRLLCLFCERTFLTQSLRQKHVDRCHSVGQIRRSSSRTSSQNQASSACSFCNKLNNSEHTLIQLLEHLVQEHSNRYFACLPCQERFTSKQQLADHNKTIHGIEPPVKPPSPLNLPLDLPKIDAIIIVHDIPSVMPTVEEPRIVDLEDFDETIKANIITPEVKELKPEKPDKPKVTKPRKVKKVAVKSMKNGVRTSLRTTRSSVKQMIAKTRKKPEPAKLMELEETKDSSTSVFSLVNAYIYTREKIYNHASDSIRDSNSVKFDAIFDKDFYNRTVYNIRDNLLHFLDGKLNRNLESESRISQFEQTPDDKKIVKEDHFGSDISLNAVTPVATLLASSQYGEDFDSQIEYGAKASQKKCKTVSPLKYKFTNKKCSSAMKCLDHADMTALDMWTQLIVKKRQQRSLDINPAKTQVEELNRVLDKRGPFEDLRLESQNTNQTTKKDVAFIVDDLLDNVFEQIETKALSQNPNLSDNMCPEVPNYLGLVKSEQNVNDDWKKLELSGEWARPRIYICATCGLKLPNIKALDDHKNVSHPHIWGAHYELVGSQSSMYRHLSIPGLGKVGYVETLPLNRIWQRSDARTCTKCAKHCHNLGELHRHVLECGGDWTWMLSRKKCKYRPYGARSRRRRQRGYKRNLDIPRPPKEYKPKLKPIQNGPRPKPSDAETIQRMLANLPPKRHRKMISMRDGIQRPRKPYNYKNSQTSVNTQENVKKLNRVMYKNNVTLANQNLKNALKRKLEARSLRQRNTEVESKSQEISVERPLNNNAKRKLTRVLGSKIFDNNTNILSRRRLVQAITNNNLIRRTRLRVRNLEKEEAKIIAKPEEGKKTDKEETKVKKGKQEETETKTEVISTVKLAKKRLINAFTKNNKKIKNISEHKEELNNKTETTENIEENETEKVKTLRKTRKGIVSDNNAKNSKKKQKVVENESDTIAPNITTDVNEKFPEKPKSVKTALSKVIRKKTNKLIQNIKSLTTDIKNKNPNNATKQIKEKGLTSKLIRTLSMRSSKNKKAQETATKNDKELKKSQLKKKSDENNDLESMPTLEKFDPLPEGVLASSSETIPTLFPVYNAHTVEPADDNKSSTLVIADSQNSSQENKMTSEERLPSPVDLSVPPENQEKIQPPHEKTLTNHVEQQIVKPKRNRKSNANKIKVAPEPPQEMFISKPVVTEKINEALLPGYMPYDPNLIWQTLQDLERISKTIKQPTIPKQDFIHPFHHLRPEDIQIAQRIVLNSMLNPLNRLPFKNIPAPIIPLPIPEEFVKLTQNIQKTTPTKSYQQNNFPWLNQPMPTPKKQIYNAPFIDQAHNIKYPQNKSDITLKSILQSPQKDYQPIHKSIPEKPVETYRLTDEVSISVHKKSFCDSQSLNDLFNKSNHQIRKQCYQESQKPLKNSSYIYQPAHISLVSLNSKNLTVNAANDRNSVRIPKLLVEPSITLEIAKNLPSSTKVSALEVLPIAPKPVEVIVPTKTEEIVKPSNSSVLNKFKNKIKRSGKGLNDCIAMLKCKLEQKVQPIENPLTDKSNLFILNSVEANSHSVTKEPEEPTLENQQEATTVTEHTTQTDTEPLYNDVATSVPENIQQTSLEDIQHNDQINLVINEAMKNSLLECVKNKCEELKNIKTKPTRDRKIGSIRRRQRRIKMAGKLPKSPSKNSAAKTQDDSEDDIPLKHFITQNKLKIKIPRSKKKRRIKKKLSFTPLILNKEDNFPIEFNIDKEIACLDNSMNDKIEGIQEEMKENKDQNPQESREELKIITEEKTLETSKETILTELSEETDSITETNTSNDVSISDIPCEEELKSTVVEIHQADLEPKPESFDIAEVENVDKEEIETEEMITSKEQENEEKVVTIKEKDEDILKSKENKVVASKEEEVVVESENLSVSDLLENKQSPLAKNDYEFPLQSKEDSTEDEPLIQDMEEKESLCVTDPTCHQDEEKEEESLETENTQNFLEVKKPIIIEKETEIDANVEEIKDVSLESIPSVSALEECADEKISTVDKETVLLFNEPLMFPSIEDEPSDIYLIDKTLNETNIHCSTPKSNLVDGNEKPVHDDADKENATEELSTKSKRRKRTSKKKKIKKICKIKIKEILPICVELTKVSEYIAEETTEENVDNTVSTSDFVAKSDSEDELPLAFLMKKSKIPDNISESQNNLDSEVNDFVENLPNLESSDSLPDLRNIDNELNTSIDINSVDSALDELTNFSTIDKISDEKLIEDISITEAVQNKVIDSEKLVAIEEDISDNLNGLSSEIFDTPNLIGFSSTPNKTTCVSEEVESSLNIEEKVDTPVKSVEQNTELNTESGETEFITTPDLNSTSLIIKIKKNFKFKRGKKTRRRVTAPRTPSKSKKEEPIVNILCDICNKTFTRTEYLIKHKRTLTHIAKLSEIEAKESMARQSSENKENYLETDNNESNAPEIDDGAKAIEDIADSGITDTHNLSSETDRNTDFNISEISDNIDELIKNDTDIIDLDKVPDELQNDDEINVIDTSVVEKSTGNLEIIDDNTVDFRIRETKIDSILNTEKNTEDVDYGKVQDIEDEIGFEPISNKEIAVQIKLNKDVTMEDIENIDGGFIKDAFEIQKSNIDEASIDQTEFSSIGSEKIETFNSTLDDLSSEIENISNSPKNVNCEVRDLKLVDIINDVLDKPMNNMKGDNDYFAANIMSQNSDSDFSEPRRYKSLGERKSFDSDSFILPQKCLDDMLSNESYTPKSVNDGMLSKQLTLLENIIEETKTNLNYIDESISLSSNQFEESSGPTEKEFENSNAVKDKEISEANLLSPYIKPNNITSNFDTHKNSNYDDISQPNFEDDKAYKDNTTRKILNRDEELFIECCSLLKSGSEISNKKSKNIPVHYNQSNQQKSEADRFIQRENYEWLTQAPRTNTPISEPFNNDWLDSNSAISSEWLKQKASPDRPVETKTIDKSNSNSQVKYSEIQFEDISLDSTATNNTLIAENTKPIENIPLNFHNVDFSKNELIRNTTNDATNEIVDTVVENEKESKLDEQVFKGDKDKIQVIEKADENKEEEKKEKSIDKTEDPSLQVDIDLKKKVVTAFGGLMARALNSRLQAVVRRSNKFREKRALLGNQPSIADFTIPLKKNKPNALIDSDSNDIPKKLITKGALKIFEGLKVSIPTQDLNLKEVLSCTLKKKLENGIMEEKQKASSEKTGNKLGLRETKKKSKQDYETTEKKDIYDFDESQDDSLKNSLLPDYRKFRDINSETIKSTDVSDDPKLNEEDAKITLETDSETDRYYDSMSFEENSVSSISIQQQPTLKNKRPLKSKLKKDNQKKCMIMGRIFKNASKPKLEDKIPEIRDFSFEENSKMVENYIESCSSIENMESNTEFQQLPVANDVTVVNSANKMTKKEMDLLFDKLLEGEVKKQKESQEISPEQNTSSNASTKPEKLKKIDKSKKCPKIKKRSRHNSEGSTSSEEFRLPGRASKQKKCNRTPRKPKKDGGINLEQEFKECIGVAGRKSQRKCTSGKQNILAEFWSSDESSFEELLRLAEAQPKNGKPEFVAPKPPIDNIPCKSPDVKTIEDGMKQKSNPDIYEFESDMDIDTNVSLLPAPSKTKFKKMPRPKIRSKRPRSENDHHRKSLESDDVLDEPTEMMEYKKRPSDQSAESLAASRRKRNAANMLYYWSSSSDDELLDMIEVKPLREDMDDDRPMQHGWIVGDSPKKLVTMLAQAKGKKLECESVKEQHRKSRGSL